jgi:transcriptional regulator with XRE-family HTH domain
MVDGKVKMTVGERIRDVRSAKGFSMRELADRLADGTHFTTIGKMETGKIRLTVPRIHQIAKALEVTFSELTDPDFSVSQARQLPLVRYRTWVESGGLKESEILGWVFSTRGSDKSVAFANREYDPAIDDTFYGYVVVDVEERSLESERLYVIDAGSEDLLDIVIYRSDPPRFDLYVDREAKPYFALGDRPFTTVGRIVFEGRSL